MIRNNQEQYHSFAETPSIHPIIKEQVFRQITVPLDGPILDDISLYRNCIDEIRDANEGDLVRIIINTEGGSLYTALAIISAIQQSAAEVIADIEGMAASAGSLIALHCQGIQLNPYSTMFIHSESFGSIGKRHEVKTQVEFSLKWVEKIIRDTYKNFLTEEEINLVLEGRDMYFDAEQLADRLNKRQELLEQEYQEQEEEDCENCSGESCKSYEGCTASIDASQFPEIIEKYKTS